MARNSREIIKRLISAGWQEVRRKGSHCQFRKEGQPNLVTVPHPKKDLPTGTVRSIARASGVDLT